MTAHPVVALTRKLVDIPSVSGDERKVAQCLEGILSAQGWHCSRQIVERDRFNLLAQRGVPDVLFSTHLDTVPPFFPSRVERGQVFGRGSCDAKGIAAAMICAGNELASAGVDSVGLLFVVGEETDSLGARTAARSGLRCRYLVNGEPTHNRLVLAHKGIVDARVQCRGVAAHSAYPERGESAIHRLIEILGRLTAADWPSDSLMGESFLNVGLIQGGRANNVIADEAEARLLLRTVTDSAHYVDQMKRIIGDDADLEIVKTTEPQRMVGLDGLDSLVVSYSTDIPELRKVGEPLLIGPGDILDAHTAEEKISIESLIAGVTIYQEIATRLLQLPPDSRDKG